MESSTNIFYKIFQIMDHYENILDNQSYSGEKYKPDESFNEFMNSDEFFAAVFKNVPVNKKPAPEEGVEKETKQTDPDEPREDPEKEKEKELPPETEPAPVETEPAPDNTSERDRVITKYIKKCYRVIVLKCHPDKNKMNVDSSSSSSNTNNQQFIKCQEYYDNNFLIGLLYIFYLYKLKPPPPLNIATPIVPEDDCSIIIDRIIREIRVIQDKLELFNMPIEVEPEPEPEVEP